MKIQWGQNTLTLSPETELDFEKLCKNHPEHKKAWEAAVNGFEETTGIAIANQHIVFHPLNQKKYKAVLINNPQSLTDDELQLLMVNTLQLERYNKVVITAEPYSTSDEFNFIDIQSDVQSDDYAETFSFDTDIESIHSSTSSLSM